MTAAPCATVEPRTGQFGRKRRSTLQERRWRAAQVTAADRVRMKTFSWRDNSCDFQFEMREGMQKNRESRLTARRRRRMMCTRRDGHQEAGVPLARGGVYSHYFRMQIVGQGNYGKQKRYRATDSNDFGKNAGPWISSRSEPAESPKPDEDQSDNQPDKIKKRFHRQPRCFGPARASMTPPQPGKGSA